MVKRKETGDISIAEWLQNVAKKLSPPDSQQVKRAYELALHLEKNQMLYSGYTLIEQGIAIADILTELSVDGDTLTAAILYYFVVYDCLSLGDIKETFNPEVSKLIAGVKKMEIISATHRHMGEHAKIDNLRKMLLAMVEDIRIVLIKLAEQTFLMRHANKLPTSEQKAIAHLTFDIYAPLANRLGIGHLKWELEDLAFRYLESEKYKSITKEVDAKRIDREKYVLQIKHILQNALADYGIKNFEITGRAKHIYSIYRKMQRKAVGYEGIFDATALRILTPEIADCYTALSCVHELWEHIPQEFDDYIVNPKPNGYRSIHTAVYGPNHKSIEVQIRTFTMHQESELGVAAHWKYKEGKSTEAQFEEKINWLRQLIDWQNELSAKNTMTADIKHLFSDRVYVFTPLNEIIDLPKGATSLDFAYHIHTQIGHRCKGAKINGHIVPLTYQLQTGDKVEILTSKLPQPSRDWLNLHSGYLITAKARAKVFHWFKHLENDKYLTEGRHLLEKELRPLHLPPVDMTRVSKHLGFKHTDDLYVALGNDEIKVNHIIQTIKHLTASTITKQEPTFEIRAATHEHTASPAVNIGNIKDLLSFPAKCCKPIPGDEIIGFITRGRGITIHRRNCMNVKNNLSPERLIEMDWQQSVKQSFPTDLVINAQDRNGLVRDITTAIANEKVRITSLQTTLDAHTNTTLIFLTIEINEPSLFQRILEKIAQVPSVIAVERRRI